MSAGGAVFRRALAHFRSLYCSAFAYAAYLAGSGALFAFNLESAESTRSSLAAVWALSAAPFLPLMAAFAGMYSWSAERASGAIDLLLSAPVRERELAAGKFFGAWAATLAAVALFFGSSVALLAVFSPKLYAALSPASFLPGFLALAMQAAA
ncbi:MAG: ABC transporter permease, partial [Kiritimatiellae bacterium]|nr:ABC transporter permease [Kiritimatiellia bacterium]